MSCYKGFEKRKKRTRFHLKRRSADRLRLSIFRSGKHVYGQIIDDVKGCTLVNASSLDKELRAMKLKGKALAEAVGKMVATRAKEKKLDKVVFDRGGYLYHGRVAKFAEGARSGGLLF